MHRTARRCGRAPKYLLPLAQFRLQLAAALRNSPGSWHWHLQCSFGALGVQLQAALLCLATALLQSRPRQFPPHLQAPRARIGRKGGMSAGSPSIVPRGPALPSTASPQRRSAGTCHQTERLLLRERPGAECASFAPSQRLPQEELLQPRQWLEAFRLHMVRRDQHSRRWHNFRACFPAKPGGNGIRQLRHVADAPCQGLLGGS